MDDQNNIENPDENTDIKMPKNTKGIRYYYKNREAILEKRKQQLLQDPEYQAKLLAREQAKQEKEEARKNREELKKQREEARKAKEEEMESKRRAKAEAKKLKEEEIEKKRRLKAERLGVQISSGSK
jgi:Zn-dependent M32 family carboxypeptidase